MSKKRFYIITTIMTIGSVLSIWLEYEFYDAIRLEDDTELTYVTVQFEDYRRINEGEDMIVEHYWIYTTEGERYTVQHPTSYCLFNGDFMQMDYGDTLTLGYIKAPNALFRFIRGEPVYSLVYEGEQMLDRECIYKEDEQFNSIVLTSLPFLAVVWFMVNVKRLRIREREEKSGRKRTVTARGKKKH